MCYDMGESGKIVSAFFFSSYKFVKWYGIEMWKGGGKKKQGKKTKKKQWGRVRFFIKEPLTQLSSHGNRGAKIFGSTRKIRTQSAGGHEGGGGG